jgi:hypothetical protein
MNLIALADRAREAPKKPFSTEPSYENPAVGKKDPQTGNHYRVISCHKIPVTMSQNEKIPNKPSFNRGFFCDKSVTSCDNCDTETKTEGQTVAFAGSEKQKEQPPTKTANPWGWLRPISDRQPCYAGKGQGPSCFSCKSYDGIGSSWPGLCRYPESMGRVALELDWNIVDIVNGCGCYQPDAKRITARDKEPDFCFDKTPFEGVAGCEPVKKKTSRVFISPVAVEWLREHRQALKAAGWTMRELYRRNRSRGLAWARVWDKMGMTATLQGEVITITFDDNGRTIKQTARPRGTVERRQEMFDGLASPDRQAPDREVSGIVRRWMPGSGSPHCQAIQDKQS